MSLIGGRERLLHLKGWMRVFAVTFPLTIGLVIEVRAEIPDNLRWRADKEATIPGHGMSEAEYPFDESGRYRTDWVSVKARSKVSNSVTVRDPIPHDSEEHTYWLYVEAKREAEREERERREREEREQKEREMELARLEQERLAREAEEARAADRVIERTLPTVTVASRSVDRPARPPIRGREVPASQQIPEETNGPFQFIGPYLKNLRTSTPRILTRISRPAPAEADQINEGSPMAKPVSAPTPTRVLYHKIEKGDTLYGISRQYEVSIAALKKENGLDSDLIFIGQQLRIPPQ